MDKNVNEMTVEEAKKYFEQKGPGEEYPYVENGHIEESPEKE